MNLNGKVSIVTGASSGIGEAIVRLFLESGSKVVAVDLDPKLPEVFAALKSDNLRCVIGDVSKEETATSYAKAGVDAFGKVDVMINNAGIALIKPIADITPNEWDRVMDVNVKSIYWSARAIIPLMQKQGGGLFLNTGSISSVVGLGAQGVYGPSKGAVIQITRTMAVDYAKDNIRVNAVCPGSVDTPLLQKAAASSGDKEGFLDAIIAEHPIGRLAAPEEIAEFFLFLASDRARFFTGAVLMIDGGFTAW